MTDERVDLDAVLAKIKALLNVKGRDEAEAALYVAKAQELLEKYDLDMATVNAKSDTRSSVGEVPGINIARHGKPEGWKVDLFAGVAWLFDCRAYTSTHQWNRETLRYEKGTFARLIGRHSDIEVALATYDYLVAELLRMQDAYGKEKWQEIWDYAELYELSHHDAERQYVNIYGTHPLKAKLSWIRGATESVIRTIRKDKDLRTATRDDSRALVVDKKADIDQYLQDQSDSAMAKSKGMTLEEYRAWLEEARAKYAAEVAARPPEPVKPTKPETEAQRRKREKSDEAYWRREEQKARTAARKLAKSTDFDALARGRQDGQRVALRKGVEG